MRGLILSGGKGSRLAPLTHTQAKQLVPVANKPILFYGIDAMIEAGINEIGIIVSPETGAEVEAAVLNNQDAWYGSRFTFIEQGEPRGLAHALLTAKEFIGAEDFCMYLGDNILQGGIRDYATNFKVLRRHGPSYDPPEALLLLTRVEDPTQYGIAYTDKDGKIEHLIEKPREPSSNLALVGVYFFSPAIVECAEAIKPSQRGELEITDAISKLIESDVPVVYNEVEGWWKDTGHHDDILQANRLVLEAMEPNVDEEALDADSIVEGRVVIEAGARIEGSTVRGPAIIASYALVQNSYIGPYTSVGDTASVQDSEVEHSILLDRSSVSDQSLTDSLVGREAYVTRDNKRPRALRVFVGDKSRVQLP